MFEEEYLSQELRKFSLLDIAFIKMVYLMCGLITATSYTALNNINWLFYFILFLIAAIPLIFHFFSFKGSLIEKGKSYIKTNHPALQVLLFFSMFFFGCMLVILIPALSLVPWYVYLGLIIIFAIKPMKTSIFW